MTTTNEHDSAADRALREELRRLAVRLSNLEAKRERLYGQRLDAWRRGRDRGWTQVQLAEASSTGEGAVTQALRRARLADR